jgi:preprotein translocase subunit YajC
MMDFLLLLAQTTKPTQQPSPGIESMLLPLLLMGAVVYFIMLRPQSSERKRHQKMLSAVKKNDRVVTIGGILGTVLNVKDDEITLKVDESSNTKITFTRAAIQKVLGTESAETPASTAQKK